jgi:hypothetical protein
LLFKPIHIFRGIIKPVENGFCNPGRPSIKDGEKRFILVLAIIKQEALCIGRED